MSQENLQREPWEERLIRDLKIFHAATGMKYTTIGIKAIKNSRFWARIEKGGSITLAKADEIYAWMAEQGHHFNS